MPEKPGIRIQPRLILSVVALITLFIGWGVSYQSMAGDIEKNTEFREENKTLPVDLNNLQRDIDEIQKDQDTAQDERKEQLLLLKQLISRPQ